MASRFYVIPVAADGFLPEEPQICDSKAEALEAAMRIVDRHAGLVIAEEPAPYEELELIRVVGRVDAEVLEGLVD
jgi:hypothetical protein